MKQQLQLVSSIIFACCQAWSAAPRPARHSRLRVFLNSPVGLAEAIRAHVGFVEYVRDSRQADVQVLVTGPSVGMGLHEYTIAFIGSGRFEHVHIVTQVGVATPARSMSAAERRAIPA